MKKQTKQRYSRKGLGLLALTVVVLAIGTVVIVHHYNKPAAKSSNQSVNLTENSKGSTPTTTDSSNPNSFNPAPIANPNVPGGSTGSNAGTQATLTAPSGNFVSNHGANSAYPVASSTNENSTCTTTPGATCNIQFTSSQGSVVSLGSQQTSTASSKDEASGTTSWTWTPGQAGLTTGTWTVAAIASLNGQTMTTTDPTLLTISP